ncbi:MAG: hypothetical protein M3Y20_06415 [Actinomycetota bacterium]|nr:hypothetical protein [Actinomycetota bacterium]
MRVSPRMLARGWWQTVAILCWAFWAATLVALVVLGYGSHEEEAPLAFAFWQTGVFLAASLPVLVLCSRRAFRADRRLGPREELVEDEQAAAAERPHQSLNEKLPPPSRW